MGKEDRDNPDVILIWTKIKFFFLKCKFFHYPEVHVVASGCRSRMDGIHLPTCIH